MTLEEIIAALPEMEGASTPHRRMPASAGEVARQLLLVHPAAPHASIEEVQELVLLLAAPDTGVHTPYNLGRRPAGVIGSPGTWISTGHAASAQYQISANVPLLYPQNDIPADPTLLERVHEEVSRRVVEAGGEPGWVQLISTHRGEFSGDDIVTFASPATPNGTDCFSGFFSHNSPPYSPGVQRALDSAAHTIVAHNRNQDEILARIGKIRQRVIKRFTPLGSEIGETVLLNVTGDATGLQHVETVTKVTVLGEALTRVPVLLRMSEPHQVGKGEFDGFLVHSRDTRRRLKMLAGREPSEVYTLCPVAARHYATLDRAKASDKAAQITAAVRGRTSEEDGKGVEMKDGRILDLVPIADGATFRGRSLMVKDTRLPETVLAMLAGRPLTDVLDDSRLAGLIVQRARTDSKGRLVVTTQPVEGVPLAPVLTVLAPQP